jgi:hypothetical protein
LRSSLREVEYHVVKLSLHPNNDLNPTPNPMIIPLMTTSTGETPRVMILSWMLRDRWTSMKDTQPLDVVYANESGGCENQIRKYMNLWITVAGVMVTMSVLVTHVPRV